jgi:hypothetical protein
MGGQEMTVAARESLRQLGEIEETAEYFAQLFFIERICRLWRFLWNLRALQAL